MVNRQGFPSDGGHAQASIDSQVMISHILPREALGGYPRRFCHLCSRAPVRRKLVESFRDHDWILVNKPAVNPMLKDVLHTADARDDER